MLDIFNNMFESVCVNDKGEMNRIFINPDLAYEKKQDELFDIYSFRVPKNKNYDSSKEASAV